MRSLIVYLFIFTLAAIFLNQGIKQKRLFNPWSVTGLVILIVFAAGRYQVGTDYYTYLQIFERFKISSWSQMLHEDEVLFSLSAKLFYSIGGRPLVFGFYAMLSLVPVYATIHKHYANVYGFIAFFSYFLLYYVTSFNIMRQYIVIGLVFWGIQFIFENKPVRFFLLILIATGFHLSAPLAGLIWFLWNHQKKQPLSMIQKFLIVATMTIVVMYYNPIINIVTGSISDFDRYAAYSESSSRGNNRDFYLHIFEVILLYPCMPYLKKKDQRMDVMFLLLVISVIIGFTGFTQPFVKRFALYYAVPAKTILFASLPKVFNQANRKVIFVLICSYVVFNFVLVVYLLRNGHLIPYQFKVFGGG